MSSFRNSVGMRVRWWVCLFGLTTVALTGVSGSAQKGHPLIYRRVYSASNACAIVVSQWGRDQNDDEGFGEVKMVWLHGVTNICQFKVWDRVVNSWTVDLDADGKPEAVVISESDGSGCYGEVKVVTLEGSRLIAVSLPNLSEEMTHEYEGHDEFRMDGNRRIVRIYPVGFRDAKLRSSKIGRRIVYEFKNMRLVTIESRLIPGLCPYWGDSTTFDDKKAPSSPFSAVSACCVL